MKRVATISTDPIADMLTRVRNGLMSGKEEVSLPHSKLKETVANILVEQGFLTGLKVVEDKPHKLLQVTIAGIAQPAKITHLSRLSTPGRRLYAKANHIPVVKRGRGIVIVSTSKGVMTGQQAKTQGLGGELICKVY